MKKNRFGFDLVFKSFRKSEEGKRYVTAIASDNLEDTHKEIVSERGILSMVKCVKDGIVRGAIDNHHSTFPFANITDAEIIQNQENPSIYEMLVELELKDNYPQSDDLWKAVEKGRDEYQLSIGGFIDANDPSAITYVKKEDGTLVRSLNALILDHIMVTAKNHAANPRTRFISAIQKSFHDMSQELDVNIIIKTSEDGGFKQASKDEFRQAILKTNFKTCPDIYDGHIHVLSASLLDENGNGFTEESVGLHPRAEKHRHEIKNYIVQDVEHEIEIVDDNKEDEDEYDYFYDNYNSNYAGMKKGKFRSNHVSYGMGCAYMIVGKKSIKNNKIEKTDQKLAVEKNSDTVSSSRLTTFSKHRAGLPVSAYALPSLKRIPHHTSVVKSGSENSTINISQVKKGLEYVNGENFLKGMKLTSERREQLRKEAREHLEKHLLDINNAIKSNRKIIRLVKDKESFKMKLSKDQLKNLSDALAEMAKSEVDEVELSEDTIDGLLSVKGNIDEVISELGLSVDETEPASDETVSESTEEESVSEESTEEELTGAGSEKSKEVDLAKSITDSVMASVNAALKDFKKEISAVSAKVAKMSGAPAVSKSNDLNQLDELLNETDDSEEVDLEDFYGFLSGPISQAAGDRAFRGNRK